MIDVRFVREEDISALEDLVRICHPQRAIQDRRWWSVIPTLVVDGVVAYTQFTLLPGGALFQCDLGVHPHARGLGIGRALFAHRLRLARSFGAIYAVGSTADSNVAMRRIFDAAGFTPGDMIQAEPEDERLYCGGVEAFTWAEAQMEKEYA